MSKRLAVIDGKSVFYRGYYAMPNLSLPDGTPTGGVYGFASLAIELIKKIEPDYVAIAWDKKDTNIRKRREMYPEYKANRKKAPDDFYAQIPILYEMLEAFDWPLYELDDYEADDIMGALAKEATERGVETYLITSDLDALQLISPMVKVFALKNGLSNLEEFSVEHFEQKYGIGVEQFLDLKALKGDSSDNLPGVNGIGEKTGIELLKTYGDLDNIYSHVDEIKPTISKKLTSGRDMAYLSKKIAQIWVDAPVRLDWEKADVRDVNFEKVAAILKKLQFSSLLRRLPRYITEKTNEEVALKAKVVPLRVVDWPEVLDFEHPVVIFVEGENLWLSGDKLNAFSKKIAEIDGNVWTALSMASVICYDAKHLYHDLAKNNIFIRFSETHEIHQAAFLIDPLLRDHTLPTLVGGELEETPVSMMAAMWHVYGQQVNAFNLEPKLARIAREFDFPLSYILFKMERRGVKIDTTLLKKMSQEIGDDYKKLEQEIYDMVGSEFNIGSPLQLSEVLFDKLMLPTTGIKKGKTGYSTGQKELDKLRGLHPIIELIEKTRELAKLKNTYVDALPLLVDENDRLHTTLNQDVVSTGRLSSTNPNLQNIPIRSELGKKIREAFVPEDGNVLVSADYSQFELRLSAILSGDKDMIEVFNSEVDIHAKTASEVYGIPIDKVTKDERRNAKVINFGVLYGMSPHGLAAATGMGFGDAKKFIDQYFEVRKPVRKFLNDVLEKARIEGYAETYFGRRRPTPDVRSSNFMVRSSAERAAANMPIQGTEADLMKLAMIKVDERIEGLGEQILQIHDSILVECPKNNAEQIAEILRDTLENIVPELKIKLKVDVSIGKSWGEL